MFWKFVVRLVFAAPRWGLHESDSTVKQAPAE